MQIVFQTQPGWGFNWNSQTYKSKFWLHKLLFRLFLGNLSSEIHGIKWRKIHFTGFVGFSTHLVEFHQSFILVWSDKQPLSGGRERQASSTLIELIWKKILIGVDQWHAWNTSFITSRHQQIPRKENFLPLITWKTLSPSEACRFLSVTLSHCILWHVRM